MKHGSRHDRLMHKDRKISGMVVETWEQQFDNLIDRLVGFRPVRVPEPQHPVTRKALSIYPTAKEQEIILYIKNTLHLPFEDNRPQGGALWVLLDSATGPSCSALAIFDFKYKPGKGWWKE